MNKKTTVLYIDDEEINLKLFEFNFSGKFEVITGNSGLKGLSLLEKYPGIQVVLSDMKMPEMNGLEFITLAKTKYNDKKFFILTAYDITEEMINAIDSGLIVKYLRKPFNIKEIETVINKAIPV
jgi:response regulator RpfG family c-di-GMP phosphodiesterase